MLGLLVLAMYLNKLYDKNKNIKIIHIMFFYNMFMCYVCIV